MAIIDGHVTLRGPLFDKTKNFSKVVSDAITAEMLVKVQARVMSPSNRAQQRLGFRRNQLTSRINGLTLTISSTKLWPRAVGTSWAAKNLAAIRSMAPRVQRKAADRITGEAS